MESWIQIACGQHEGRKHFIHKMTSASPRNSRLSCAKTHEHHVTPLTKGNGSGCLRVAESHRCVEGLGLTDLSSISPMPRCDRFLPGALLLHGEDIHTGRWPAALAQPPASRHTERLLKEFPGPGPVAVPVSSVWICSRDPGGAWARAAGSPGPRRWQRLDAEPCSTPQRGAEPQGPAV